jgi:hypothetical protein
MYITYIIITGVDDIELFSLKRTSIENSKLKLNIYCYISVVKFHVAERLFLLEKYDAGDYIA